MDTQDICGRIVSTYIDYPLIYYIHYVLFPSDLIAIFPTRILSSHPIP